MLEHCGKFLPPAKTPKQVLIVPDLPKSDRGKVLRDKLREDWAGAAEGLGLAPRLSAVIDAVCAMCDSADSVTCLSQIEGIAMNTSP